MTGKLEPPRQTAPETEQPSIDVFPYDRSGSGVSLLTRKARGVLCSSDGTVGRAGASVCPTCGSETLNGVGLFTCTDCEWTGRLE